MFVCEFTGCTIFVCRVLWVLSPDFSMICLLKTNFWFLPFYSRSVLYKSGSFCVPRQSLFIEMVTRSEGYTTICAQVTIKSGSEVENSFFDMFKKRWVNSDTGCVVCPRKVKGCYLYSYVAVWVLSVSDLLDGSACSFFIHTTVSDRDHFSRSQWHQTF